MRTIGKSLCMILFGLLMLMSIQSCYEGDRLEDEYDYVKKSQKPQESKAVSDINKKISDTREHIRGLEEFRTEQLHIAVINDVRNHQTEGKVKLDGHPTYEDIASRAYTEVAAAETEIERLKRKLAHQERERQEIMRQSSGCFLPETLVKMEDGSLKPFMNLQPGQRVVTYDIGYDKLVSREVVKVYSVKSNHLYTINKQLTTTGGERLLTQNGWKKIRNLKKGDFVHMDGSMVEIKSIDYIRINRTLYNIQVADTHNFYVVNSDGSAFLVHNTSSGSSSGSGSK